MKAAVLSIGDELLIGQTINTNAAFIGESLAEIGVEIQFSITISDNKFEILRWLTLCETQVDVVLITGGLGPTQDDITKHTLCEYFNTKLVRNESVLKIIEEYFISRGRELLEINRMQADLPESCEMLFNKNGTAPGMWFERNNKIVVSMPGVPYEMKGIMIDSVIPRLEEKNKLKKVRQTILTTGMGESFIAIKIQNVEQELRNAGLALAYLPSPGIVKLRVSAVGYNENDLNIKVNHYTKSIKNILGNICFAEGDTTMEQVVFDLLNHSKKTVSFIESCSGGNTARLMTSIPGASNVFLGSVTAYDNSAKTNVVNIDTDKLREYGAVSEWCAIALSTNGRKIFNTDYCVSTTGIAGPNGGSEEKPVGTVWIGIAGENFAFAKKFIFVTNRTRNIQMTSIAALNLLRLQLTTEN